jgi:Flp pilus assembly protein TadD
MKNSASFKPLARGLTLLAWAAWAGLPAQAADTPSPEPEPARAASAQPLAAARAHIEGKRWAAALDELRRVNATNDADWNNLMGYSLRKQAKPDLSGAQRHYDAALKINPHHQGALEYAGELALMKGDVATAETHLATLSRLCSTPCEPLDDLKKAVADHKAGRKP